MKNVYGLTQEQLDFAAAVREFARKEVGSREKFNELTNFGDEPHIKEIHERLAATDFMGVSIPEEYGGSGGGLMEMVLLFEELWRGLVPVHGLGPSHTCAGVYTRYGTERHAAVADSAKYLLLLLDPRPLVHRGPPALGP